MAEAEHQPTNAPEPVISAEQTGDRNWVPMGIGVALVVIVVALVVVFTRGGEKTQPANPYNSKLEISNLHMATAENFAGGTVTYIEGTLANSGDRKLTGAWVEVQFKNALGEVAQKEQLPMMVLLPNSPYVDYGPLDRAPLASGQSRGFRLTLEHITADWDGQIPQVRVTSVSTS
jgi:hypothetical protein